MDETRLPREHFEPPQLPRGELPHEFPPAAHAACDEGDEPDTDVELADDGGPDETGSSGRTQFSNDD